MPELVAGTVLKVFPFIYKAFTQFTNLQDGVSRRRRDSRFNPAKSGTLAPISFSFGKKKEIKPDGALSASQLWFSVALGNLYASAVKGAGTKFLLAGDGHDDEFVYHGLTHVRHKSLSQVVEPGILNLSLSLGN